MYELHVTKSQFFVFAGSMFSNFAIDIRKQMLILYCWINCETRTKCAKDLKLGVKVVGEYYKMLRTVSSRKLDDLRSTLRFGGIGRIVQIDESVFVKRKYNVGRIVPQKWFLGFYDNTTKKALAVFVPKRDRKTLIPLIRRYVRIGSVIRTDKWAAYNDLSKFGYSHETVNHKRNFVNPLTGAHTQAIESYWSRTFYLC